MSRPYDVIVIGLGGMGSATCAQLASRGQKVLGIEQFDLGHARGSSHGETRVIRQAYFEHPNYVPLLKRAYELWEELENQAGTTLFHRCGVLVGGTPQSEIILGVEQAVQIHKLQVDSLSISEATKRFPQFKLPSDFKFLFESNAGYLEVENCVLQNLRLAEKNGAFFKIRERVISWKSHAQSVEVKTTHGSYEAGQLIITTGAWLWRLLSDLGIGFRILRKRLHWFNAGEEFSQTAGMPCYLFDLPDGSTFYGFPKANQRGLKVAEHSDGEALLQPEDLLDLSRGEGPARAQIDLERTQNFIKEYLPKAQYQTLLAEASCMYEMSPDSHFIIDRHPVHPNVTLAGGFSGHGFKFATVVGEILADYVTTGSTQHQIDFLRLARFLQRPTIK